MTRPADLIRIRNTEASWIALILAIPSYLIVLIGTSAVLQGCFYLLYLVGLGFVWQRQQQLHLSPKFVLTTLIFFSAWIIPNLYVARSGRLESEMLSLPVLFYHVTILFLVVLWFRSWTMSTSRPRQLVHDLARPLVILLSPLVVLILIESLRLKLQFPDQRPDPFNYRHLNGEVILMFVLAAVAMPGRWIKIGAVILAVGCLTLIENRGGLLSVAIVVSCLLALSIMRRLTWKYILLAALGIATLLFIFQEPLYELVDFFFLLEHGSRGLGTGFTHRLPVWVEAWHEIQRVPWTGVGFWVSPFPFIPFGEHVNPGRAVHNAFLRLWVENGTVLFAVTLSILLLTAVQIERKALSWQRMAFYSILAYYFFIPRHLTLNPLSMLLYLVILQALCLPMTNNKK